MKTAIAITPDQASFGPLVFRGDLFASIQKAAAIGYDAVDMHIRDPHTVDEKALLAHLSAHRMAVSAVGTGLAYGMDGLSFASEDEGTRRQAVERVKAHVDFAAPLSAVVVIGLIRGRLSSEAEVSKRERAWIAGCTRELDAYAQSRGVRLVVEPINRYETNVINRVDEAVAFISENGLRATGVHVDTFHMNIEEASLQGAIRTAGSLLYYAHLSDSNRWYPGGGHLKLASVIAALREVGYDGYLGMEILPLPDPDTAAREALANLRRLLGA